MEPLKNLSPYLGPVSIGTSHPFKVCFIFQRFLINNSVSKKLTKESAFIHLHSKERWRDDGEIIRRFAFLQKCFIFIRKNKKSQWTISTSQLNPLRDLHTWPINLVVFKVSHGDVSS